jgi:hypothetical protein
MTARALFLFLGFLSLSLVGLNRMSSSVGSTGLRFTAPKALTTTHRALDGCEIFRVGHRVEEDALIIPIDSALKRFRWAHLVVVHFHGDRECGWREGQCICPELAVCNDLLFWSCRDHHRPCGCVSGQGEDASLDLTLQSHILQLHTVRSIAHWKMRTSSILVAGLYTWRISSMLIR